MKKKTNDLDLMSKQERIDIISDVLEASQELSGRELALILKECLTRRKRGYIGRFLLK